MTERFNSINVPELYPDNICRINELELKVEVLEKVLKEMASRQPIVVEKVCIRRVDTDKIELKLDKFNVKRLKGMLNLTPKSKDMLLKTE